MIVTEAKLAPLGFVAPQPGATLEPARLLARFDGRLARFKHPKELLVVDALPRTALGKVRKEDVRQLVAARLAAPAAANQEHKA